MQNNGTHDPNARLDWTFDWAAWLRDADTITAAEVTSDEVTIENVTHDTTSVTCWITGGTNDTVAKVKCSIETAEGRKDDRTIRLRVTER